ncbi:hypothetical protein ABPG72_008930 [Tetrahymena utriculariae]
MKSACLKFLFLFFETKEAKLTEKKQVSPDSYVFRFSLTNQKDAMAYPAGSHFAILRIPNSSDAFKKKYTPINTIESMKQGYIETVIKIYRPNTDPKYPQGGKLTPFLENLKIGDIIKISGPIISINYDKQGYIDIIRKKQQEDKRSKQRIKPKNLFLIAGGTGIAPIFSIAQQICLDQQKDINITLLYANRTEKDILLKDQIDDLQKQYKNFKTIYVIDSGNQTQTWNGEIGRIDQNMIQKYGPSSADKDNYVMFCGPKGMVKMCFNACKNLGFDPYHYFRF